MSENKLLTTSEVAKKLGVTPDCIRKWDESGVLKADYTTEGGHRKYKESTVNEYLEKDTLNDFNKIMANVREEWAKKMYQELSEKIEERTNSYLTDEEKKTCVPVVKIGDYDTISLKKDGFNVSTFFYLSGHPFLSDGNYCTNMKTRYEYMTVSTGKSNQTLEEWSKDDIDNVWAYINWEYYYTNKTFIWGRIQSDDFIKILLKENFNGLFYHKKDSIVLPINRSLEAKNTSDAVEYYGRFIKRYAEQVINYHIINKCNNELCHSDDEIRSFFKKGNYRAMNVIFRGGVYKFEFENSSYHAIWIHIFDEDKFQKIMTVFRYNFIGCLPAEYKSVYVDDIIGETFGDVKEEEKEDKFTKLNTDLNDENKVWKEDELVTFDFPIITEIKDNHGVIGEECRKACCPYCKTGYLESKTPTMYNPFSMESQAVCECTNCGKTVKTEHAYPRVVFTDENGDNLNVWLS